MADPYRLSPAQQRALARVRCEGLLCSRDGVTTATIQCLEREGMVRVTWTRRNVYARHHETGVWETRTECDWLAEPVIDDYRVTLLCGDREVQVTVYAVVGRTEALQAARERFWERFCGGVHLEVAALDIELLTVVPGFLL